MKKFLLTAMAVIAIGVVTVNGSVIYSDNFDGSSSVGVNGTTPDISSTGASWIAATGFQADGSFSGQYKSMTLEFSPVDGMIYILEASFSDVSSANWIAFGYASGQSTSTGGNYRFVQTSGTVIGKAWCLYKGVTNVSSHTYAATDGSGGPDMGLSGAVDVRIILDTTAGSGNWAAQWYAKLPSETVYTLVRAKKILPNQTINSVGFANNGTTGKINSFSLEASRAAVNPLPASLDIDVPLTQTLSWDAGIDMATGTYADVSEYHVYIGGPVTDTSLLADPNLLNDPNLTSKTSAVVYETGSNGGSWTPPAGFLERDITYAWRVDEKLTDGTIVTGYNWAFTTVLSVPAIDPALPADTAVGLGEYGELIVVATNPFTGDATGLSYQWMYSADGVTYSAVGTDSPILAIASAQPADQGNYYCDVTLVSNGKIESSTVAYLIVKQALAHWTMDQADFAGGQYVDIVGGHNADANSTPTFVDGAGPDMPAAGAAVINPDSFATVGTWNPSETTGQITLSAWIKWDGTMDQYGNIILGKRDGWGADLMMWDLRIRDIAGNGNAGIRFYNASGMSTWPTGVVPPNTWTHVCAVYGDGQAQVYVNGVLKGTDDTAEFGTGTESALTIGGTTVFPGAMDEVMIHNYAMSAEDVATLYYQTSQEGICLYPSETDLNNDCETNVLDLAILAQTWLECGKAPAEDCFQ